MVDPADFRSTIRTGSRGGDPLVVVHARTDEGEENRLVVTIEAETVDASHAVASSFIEIDGVMNINLVYANFEDDPSLRKA